MSRALLGMSSLVQDHLARMAEGCQNNHTCRKSQLRQSSASSLSQDLISKKSNSCACDMQCSIHKFSVQHAQWFWYNFYRQVLRLRNWARTLMHLKCADLLGVVHFTRLTCLHLSDFEAHEATALISEDVIYLQSLTELQQLVRANLTLDDLPVTTL